MHTRTLSTVLMSLLATGAFLVACSSSTPTCPKDETTCSGTCTSLTEDEQNCGACGVVCAGGQACVASHCQETCASGYTTCGASSAAPYCALLPTDVNNCGTCGKVCPAGNTCSSGMCQPVGPGMFSAGNSSITVSSATQTADGVSVIDITVTGEDSSGHPLVGAAVALSASGAGNTLIPEFSVLSATGTFAATISSTVTQTETIVATIGGADNTVSTTITFVPGAKANAVFQSQPGNVVAGVPFAPAVTVALEDAFGNVITTDSSTTVSLVLGMGSALTGGASQVAVDGVATFPGLSVSQAGTNTLVITAAGYTGATSTAFTVTSAAATQLVFGTQPSTTRAGALIAPAVTVTVNDAFGNVMGSSFNVTLALGENTTGGSLHGTITEPTVNGVATFADLSVDTPGTGYTLLATMNAADGPTEATSSVFDVTLGAPGPIIVVPAQTTATVSWQAVAGASSYNVYYRPFPISANTGAPPIVVSVPSNALPPATVSTVVGTGGAQGAPLTAPSGAAGNTGAGYGFAVTAVVGLTETTAGTQCAVTTNAATGGLALYDPLCGNPDGSLWDTPLQTREIQGNQLVMTSQVSDVPAYELDGAYIQTQAVLAGTHGGRVTELSANVTVPSASQTGLAVPDARVRLLYQPSADRGHVFPHQDQNLLQAALDVAYTGGSAPVLRVGLSECDDDTCVARGTSAFSAFTWGGFTQDAVSPLYYEYPAAFGTTYTLDIKLDESTNQFTWTITPQGGTPFTGTATVSSEWLTSVGMELDSASNGFSSAQILTGVSDRSSSASPADLPWSAAGSTGDSAQITAQFSDVQAAITGINSGNLQTYDDFATLGSNATTGLNPALWASNGGAPDYDACGAGTPCPVGSGASTGTNGTGLQLHADLTDSTTNAQTFYSLMVPVTDDALQADVTIWDSVGNADIVLMGAYYNTGSAGGWNNATGDIRVQIGLNLQGAYWIVQKCVNAGCSGPSTNLGTGGVPLDPANYPMGAGTTHTLYQAWDAADQVFVFQVDDAPALTVDPTTTNTSGSVQISDGAPVTNAAPFVQFGGILTYVSANATGTSYIDATVNNVFTAQAPFCDSPQELLSDNANCGACGNQCAAGSACSAGACGPLVIPE